MVTTPKQQFIHFLKENNAYEKYVYNFNNREEKRNKVCPKSQFFSRTKPVYYVNKAFTWCNTKEGNPFWFNLSVEWKRCYTKNDNLKVIW